MMAGCCRRPSRGWLEPAAPSECCRADFPPSRDAPADSPPLAEAVRSAACRLRSKRAVRASRVMISPFVDALSHPRLLRGAVGVMLASVLTCAGCDRACQTPSPSKQATAAAWLSRDLARLDGAPPELQQQLQDSPHALFRFVNQAWMQDVCAAFSSELQSLPAVRLHGDAHIEQYAATADARGLDDFDDSAIGPGERNPVDMPGSAARPFDDPGAGRQNA